MQVCGFDPGWMAKFLKFLELKSSIKIFPQLSKTQIYYQIVEVVYGNATIFAFFMYSVVLLHFLYFENSPFYIVKITFCSKVMWVRNFQMRNLHGKFWLNQKVILNSSVRLSKLTNTYNNSIWLMSPLSTIVQEIFVDFVFENSIETCSISFNFRNNYLKNLCQIFVNLTERNSCNSSPSLCYFRAQFFPVHVLLLSSLLLIIWFARFSFFEF